ncbi:hypothetical protein HCB38_07685 [Listeria sp. FSL L7-0083]|uniref:hypothetical protein n=1 Tax=Listeria farberi TaxID=2713500 RepID=UPI0016292B87|nr:hypothetical protein [Listeria farberi]MBC2267691.1 hypothetical protein [Listeria farberi]
MSGKQAYRYGIQIITIREFDKSLPIQKCLFKRIRCKHDFKYRGLGEAGIKKLYICDSCGQVNLR